jgi:hypothetical protein
MPQQNQSVLSTQELPRQICRDLERREEGIGLLTFKFEQVNAGLRSSLDMSIGLIGCTEGPCLERRVQNPLLGCIWSPDYE